MIRAAVCGLGIGMAHCAGYIASDRSELVGVCDLLPERTRYLGGTFDAGSMGVLRSLFPQEMLGRPWEEAGVQVYSGMEGILRDPDIDAVSLCTPGYLHAAQAVAVLRSGKHLLLEKPIALQSEAAAEIVELGRECAESAGTLSAVGYEFRICPPVLRMRQLIGEGFVGPVSAFSLHHFRTPFKRDKWQGWIQQERLSGGLIVEETSHWIDLARYITGLEISSVHAVTTDTLHPDFDYEDLAFIQGRFQNDAIYQISHALSGFDFDLTLAVHGPEGVLWCGLKAAAYSALDAGASAYCGVLSRGRPGASPDEAVVETYGEEVLEPVLIRDYVGRFAAASAEAAGAAASADAGEGGPGDPAAAVPDGHGNTERAAAPAERTLCSLEDAATALDVSLAARASARTRKEVLL